MASSPTTNHTPSDPSPATNSPTPPHRPSSPADPDRELLTAGAEDEDGDSRAHSEGCLGILPPLKLPPPPDRLPPNFTPPVVTDASQASTEKGWVEVGGQHRRRLERLPAPPRKKETDRVLAFKRRAYGLCFRCLAEDHFVADCRRPITCLGCGRAGYRERGCPDHLPASHGHLHSALLPPAAPHLPTHPPQAPSLRLQKRSWASVVAAPTRLVQGVPCSNSGAPCSGLSDPDESTLAADLGLLKPLFAAQTEALRAELQALVTARAEEVVQPLRDMAVALQGWAAQVSGLLERLEAISGKFVDLPAFNQSLEVREGGNMGNGGGSSSLAPLDLPPPWCEHDETAPFVVADDVLPVVDVVLHEIVIQGEEEQAKVAEIVTSSNNMEHIEVALPDGLVGEVPPFVSSSVTLASGGTTNMLSSGSEEPLGDIGAPSTTMLDEFLSSFSCAAPGSLLEEPIHMQIDGASTCSERRSGRLDKKNRNGNIPTAKRAEYRLAEAYGEPPKGMTSKKGSEEDVQEKMNSYLRMYKKPLTPTSIQAIRALVEANG
uniref:CCHC-type domain-containing protein n=1 Tax=Aegilops tauschii subsp. strangulata TaxID=200361 RepID=A0A453ADB2_AEGTS